MKPKDFRCPMCNGIKKGVNIKLLDLGDNKDPIYKANCETCGFEMFTKPEYDPPNYNQYITAIIISGTIWTRFRFIRSGFMLCRDRFNRMILDMKDIDQAINDFSKLNWELIFFRNIKTFPDYKYIKKEYKLIKTNSIFYLVFKRKYSGGKLIPEIGHDYKETRSEEIKDLDIPDALNSDSWDDFKSR